MSEKAAGTQTLSELVGAQMKEDEDEDEEGQETEDGEPKLCAVCGDLAKGYHFNALTCEGCKGFFRRSIKRSSQLHCSFRNKCIITKNNRRSCQACRLQKCQAIGMRKDMVMSEEDVLKRRIRIKKRKMHKEVAQLSSQQEKIIQELLSNHRSTFDSAFSRFTGFRPMDREVLTEPEHSRSDPQPSCPTKTCASHDPASSSHVCSVASSSSACFSGSAAKQEACRSDRNPSIYTALPHMADLTTYMIHDIIRFSKSLQNFRSLTIEDQISLLKGATFEIMQIRFNMVFNVATSNWDCGHISYCIHDAVRAGFQPLLLDPMFKFHHALRKLDLQEEEYALIQAMSLFSPDRPGVKQHGAIDRVHEDLALTLKAWIDCKRTGAKKHLLYPKVISCLTELRTMTEEYSKQVLQIQDVQPDTIHPLIMEVVSKTSCNNV
ncbi:nuclear receptor subfamily 1 group I member 2 isoform X2 [Austrofundulus limnaeus]|uniref:Nuclear receptor subfamily 1 group I member 2 isoform X2 n=1 Tax=Austrofundulus limnaeus TaxID=52670 RepID=A0A2I4CRI3_AUSLI|nr:PREDICTED: nuclear receptor subfamily 1 group I member 2 isoform X2 [Austrofundulus limnaeus]